MYASFPFIASTSALTKTTLHHEGNVMPANFPSIMKESTSTSAL